MGAMMKKGDLTKALDELEAASVSKGERALQEADTEGGLSTEGQPLSAQIAKKSATKAAKAMNDAGSCSSSSYSGSSDDEATKGARKSLREEADGNEKLAKGFNASEFLNEMYTNISDAFDDLRKATEAQAERLVAQATEARQEGRSFDVKMAKAMVKLFDRFDEFEKSVDQRLGMVEARINKALGAPDLRQRPITTSERDLVQPPLQKSSLDHPLDSIPTAALDIAVDNLFKSNHIRDSEVMYWEQHGCDPRFLPDNIQKALIQQFSRH
jgi:hypothetical protein